MRYARYLNVVLFAAMLLCSFSAHAETCSVTALTDSGAGTGGASGTGDLRYCITQTNANPGADTIEVTAAGTLFLANNLPGLVDTVTINGGGLTINAQAGVGRRGMYVISGGVVQISNLILVGGNAGDGAAGGGIFVESSPNVTLTNVIIQSNRAGRYGAGVFCTGSSLSINDSTIIGNLVTSGNQFDGGGGIYQTGCNTRIRGTRITGNTSAGPSVYIQNGGSSRIDFSSIDGNSSGIVSGNTANDVRMSNVTISGNGGVSSTIFSSGFLRLRNCTVVGSGGTVLTNQGPGYVQLANTILTGGFPQISNTGRVTSNGGNFVVTISNFGTVDGLGFNTADPLLNPLAMNGGPTPTRTLQAASPAREYGRNVEAIDSLDNAITTDQRLTAELPRIFNTNVDSGAAEYSLIVANNNGIGIGSLRQMIADAGDGDTIQFYDQFFNVPRTIYTAGFGAFVVNKTITIEGPADTSIELTGYDFGTEAQDRIFLIQSLGNLTLRNFRLSRGGNFGQSGGCIHIDQGSLTASNLTFADCNAGSGGGAAIYNNGTLNVAGSAFNGGLANFGGAIFNETGRTTTITDSGFSSNSAGDSGGAIYSNGPLHLWTTDLIGNFAQVGGGGIFSNGPLDIRDTNIASNRSLAGGGGILATNITNLTDSIVENNQANGTAGVAFVGTSLTANILRSTIRGNIANNNTGGILNAGTLNLIDSTVSGNRSPIAGGINTGGVLNVINSTISGNRTVVGLDPMTTDRGAGIYNVTNGSVFLLNATITNNRSASNAGSGIWNNNVGNPTPTVRSRNSIVAGNLRDVGVAQDWLGDVSDLGNSIINVASPGLAPLGDHGGATPTHALLQTSSALNAGSDCALVANSCGFTHAAVAMDQRGTGAPRKIGSSVDIGAYERNITFSPATLPTSIQNYSYAQQLTTTRLTSFSNSAFAPFTYSVVDGTLPPGLVLDPASGLLAGRLTNAGLYNFSVKATDADGMAGVQSYSIQVFGPTAGNVSVQGRLLTSDGRGVRGAAVKLINSNGEVRTAISGSLGYFRFDDVPSGETYTVTVRSKQFEFAPRIISITDVFEDLELIASP